MIIRANLSRPYSRTALDRFDVLAGPAPDDVRIAARGSGAIAQYAREVWGKGGRASALSGSVGQGGSSPDAARIEAASIGFGTMLHNRIGRPDVLYKRLAKVLRTNKLLNRELWLDSLPKMRLWEGDKVLSMLRAESLAIVTRPHEASIMVPKRDIINDELGLYTDRINGLGDSYNWHLDEMYIGMLIAGLQGTALGTTYDGQNLIDTDHTFLGNGSGSTYSNKVTGAFSSTTYNEAWGKFNKMKDENGLPIMPAAGRKFVLLHGEANRLAVRTVLNQDTVAVAGGTQQNLDRGTAEPMCSSWITAGATYNVLGVTVTLSGLEWFLIPEGSSAILLQIKKDVEYLAVDTGNDEFTFRTGKFLYGIESEDGAAYGLPQEIVGGTGA